MTCRLPFDEDVRPCPPGPGLGCGGCPRCRCRAGATAGRGGRTGPRRARQAVRPVAVAVAGLRARDLQVVRPDDSVEILRMLSTRRQEVVAHRIATVNRLHDVLCHLIPGGAKRHLSATKARQLLSAVRPRDAVGKAPKQLALDSLGELERLDARLKELKKSLTEVLAEQPTTLREVKGSGRQRCEDPRRDRRRPPVPQPAPLRQLHRHSTGRRLQRGQQPAPAQPLRQPPAQPRPAHRRHRPESDARPGPGLLPAQARPGQDPPQSAALPQTAPNSRIGHCCPRRSSPESVPGSAPWPPPCGCREQWPSTTHSSAPSGSPGTS